MTFLDKLIEGFELGSNWGLIAECTNKSTAISDTNKYNYTTLLFSNRASVDPLHSGAGSWAYKV